MYEAYDPKLRRMVALKVAKPGQLASNRRVERFRRHAHLVGSSDRHRIQASGLLALPATQPRASWFAALIPLLGWANGPAGQESIGAGLAAATAIYCTFLAAQVASVHRRAAPVHPADLLLFHANALGSFAVAYSLLELTQRGATGWLALAFATWHGGLGLAAVQRQRDDSIHAAALAFTLLTISVSLLLSGPWMTVAWAAEGGAAIALGLREKRTWFRIAGGLLLAVAIGRLLGLLFSTPRLNQPLLFNRRVAVAVFVIALTYALAWLHDRASDADHWMEVAAAVVLAQVLTVALVTSEIVAYWRVHDVGRPAALAEGLMISVAWAAYAAGLIVVGIARRYAPIRYAAFMLFGITIAKVFAVDLPTLDRIYRVSSVIALGIALLSVAYGYQRFRVELPADDVK